MSEQQSINEEFLYQLISSHIRELSKDNLSIVSKKQNISIHELNNFDDIHNHGNVCWNLSLLVKIESIQIIFGCHFNNSAEKDLISSRYNIGADNKASESYYKLFGEFCNLTGGGIRRSIYETFKCISSAYDNDKSVPQKMVSQFQELMKLKEKNEADCWVLQWDKQYIICYSYISIGDDKVDLLIRELSDRQITKMVSMKGGEIELF
ncbi:MAG: hypothetical protein HQK51_17760 [Oligoflexia bacterium]|nr:hypothetical protein [Oligoflexia bacterium]